MENKTVSNAYEYINKELAQNVKPEPIFTFSFHNKGKMSKYRRISQFKKEKFTMEMEGLIRSFMQFIDFNDLDYILYTRNDEMISSAMFIYNVNDKTETYFDVISGKESMPINVEMSHLVQDWLVSVSGGYGTSRPLQIKSQI